MHGGAYAQVSLAGIWIDGCVPDAVSDDISLSRIALTLESPSLNVGCTDALTPWSLQTMVGPLSDGTYDWTARVDAVDPADRTVRELMAGPALILADYEVLVGDFDGDGRLKASDIDRLTVEVVLGRDEPLFDLDRDGIVGQADRKIWVEDLKQTTAGDTNLNGIFNPGDLVRVFQKGEYEDAIVRNSTWEDGDWDGDLEFSSGDMVAAFQGGGYRPGANVVSTVPEPHSLPLIWLGLLAFRRRRS
jgi:hypothetical protein